ncbi:MAG: DUF4231 domain-containing protein [Anaerolineae bacterium]|nr:DUF4231 domain-containing protein [Anaerolineae bacterium]
MAVSMRPASRKRWYNDLFFIKRRPIFRGLSIEWDRPADEDDYQKLIDREGFISHKYWHGGDLSKYPTITQDLKDLDQHLLPTFFEFSQKSKYFQNDFYLYQWIFALGAFFTTLFGTLAATVGIAGGNSAGRVLSYMTAIVGAVTAYYTTLSNRGEPQKRWGKTRRLAEELRMNYFKYLSHLPPYDQADRVQKLRETVIDIRVKEQENG